MTLGNEMDLREELHTTQIHLIRILSVLNDGDSQSAKDETIKAYNRIAHQMTYLKIEDEVKHG
jgi:hypothetical protein